jgi:hypothetical protein
MALVGALKTTVLIGIWRVKTVPVRTLLGTCLHFCPCPEILNKAEFKHDGLTKLAEKFEHSRPLRLWHDYFWLPLARFAVRTAKNHVEIFGRLAVWPEREGMVPDKIGTIKKKPGDMHADALRHLRSQPGPHSSTQGCKVLTHLEDLPLRR